MFVFCECCVLSGRGLCDELITRPEESYRLWCVVMCDLEKLKNEEATIRVGSQRHKKKKKKKLLYSSGNWKRLWKFIDVFFIYRSQLYKLCPTFCEINLFLNP